MRIHYIQHVPFEGLGYIKSWAEKKEYTITCTKMYAQEELPLQDDFDWLIIMGGPMSVNDIDDYPWLIKEEEFVKQAIGNNKIVLGICLGAQMIAKVLGSKIYPGNDKEIGWFPLDKVICDANAEIAELFPHEIEVFHWHGETFDLPNGCKRLASSDVCENQAFVYNQIVMGLQFHLESTNESIQQLIKNCSDEIVNGTYIQKPDEMLPNEGKIEKINRLMARILNYLENKYQTTQQTK